MSLERPTFPTARFVEAYDVEEVDLAVEMVLENLALARPRIDRGDIERLRFTPVRMRPGYTMGAVDEWLDEVLVELDRRGGEQRVATTEPTDREPSASSPTHSEAVVEVESASTRWLVMLAVVVVFAVMLYVSFA